jgi:hypothetical protein
MNNFISLAQAIAMTQTYRAQKENILAAPYKNQDILPICETFDRAAFEALLSEPDCSYIRVYLGMGEDLKVRVIAVGADSAERDILPARLQGAGESAEGDGNIVEDGMRCPTICPPASPLNS